jgi:hypothetical protein
LEHPLQEFFLEVNTLAYKLELPSLLTGVHDIFHVSQLKKCLKTPMDVVLPEVAPLEADLTYPEHPIKIFDQKSHVIRRKMIKFKHCRSPWSTSCPKWSSGGFAIELAISLCERNSVNSALTQNLLNNSKFVEIWKKL